MKRFSIFVIGSFLTFCSLFATNFEEIFLHANNLYLEQKYQEALGTYSTIEPKGWAVWYNMGLCWNALDNPLQALLHAKRAEKEGGPRNQQIENLILEATKKLSLPTPTQHSLFIALIKSLSVRAWQLIVLIIWFTLNYLLWFFYQKRKKPRIISGTFFLLLLVATFFLGFSYSTTSENSALVAENSAAFSGKNERFEQLFELKKGEEVILITSSGEWNKMRKNGKEGWIQASRLIII